MEIRCARLVLRPWNAADGAALVRHANDREVWRNLRDRFPHPYTARDAAAWFRLVASEGHPPLNFALVLEGEAVGGAGLVRLADVSRCTAEVGYWLGRRFWNRGLATEATRALAAYAFERFDFERLEAGVFAWNPASCRVLEKAGFRLEARLRRSAIKEGRVVDTLLYARLRDDGA